MTEFIGKDFLLQTPTAKTLYHEHAAKMPIVDYHCHISPEELAKDHKFKNITEVWLGGDHYKWRLMRANGVDEKYITGDGDDYEKFLAYAKTLPRAIGNPLYAWTHLELQRFFDCYTVLSEDTAEEIWNYCNDKLQNNPDFSARGLVARSNVTALATTDDPLDTLEWHEALAADDSFKTKVYPAWRPDKAIVIANDIFPEYISKLSAVAGVAISSFKDVCSALAVRMDHFDKHGCRASDHGINGVTYAPATTEELDAILAKRLAGNSLSQKEIDQYEYNMLVFLGGEYHKRNWVFEIHIGAGRNANDRMFAELGPDTGYDYIHPHSGASGIPFLLNELDTAGHLPKTVLFSLNPNDNEILSVIAGSFQKAGIKGNVQQGAAWWFNDTKNGMESQLKAFADSTLLQNFLGMLTDSRSFLSYPRHEYFRRILCNLIGEWVENGEYPNDPKALGQIVEDISYNNAIEFFRY